MRTAFWLAVLVAGLALGWWLLATRHVPVAGTPDAAPVERLLSLPLVSLSGLAFDHGDRHARIVRSGEVWSYVPADGSAGPPDQGAAQFIDERLAMFSAARVERSLAVDPGDFARYGIDPAGLTVSLFARSETRPAHTLRAGGRTPDGFGQYVLLEHASRIVVVPAYHIDNLLELASGPPARAPP